MAKLNKYSVIFVLVALPALAQQPMSEEDMQRMMQGVMQMASCMENINEDSLTAFAAEAEAADAEIRQLCADGERDAAQHKAMALGLKFAQSETFQQMRQCGEAASGLMPKMPDYSAYGDDEDDGGSRHVCDEF